MSIANICLIYIMKWKGKLLSEFIRQLKNSDHDWETLIDALTKGEGVGLHIAIFNEPYLSAMIEKRKTLESRFSVNRISPFRRIYEGDIVLIKRSAGNVIGFFQCGKIKYWTRNRGSSFSELESEYGKLICTSLEPEFWESREDSRYGTLIEIHNLSLFKSFGIDKQDRTTWVVLKERNKPSIFNDLLNVRE